MPRFPFAFILCAIAAAQQPAELFTKAPPEVDAALRARIAKFYQFHVEGKFRQAEALVAEDTKDFFYSANKPRYLSFEISRIDYSDEFRKAKGTIIVETIVPVIGFADRPLKVPIPSYWKLENGDWFWYVDQEALNKTPWGTRKASEAGAGSSPPGGAAPAIPDPRQLLDSIAAQVTADKNALRLTPGSSGEVTIRNGLPGAITLAIEGGLAKGLAARLDRAELKTGEKAVVTVSARNDMPATSQAPHVVAVRAQPTNQLFEIQVTVAAK